jgi:hypothetical protein
LATPPPTGFDVNVILNTLLGGAITIVSSLAVAAVYIRNQNKVQRKRRLREMIQRDYFDKCLNPTLGALSEYGLNTTFALSDSSVALGQYIHYKENPEELNKKLKEISSRSLLVDLTTHNFTHISEYLPLMQKFGLPIYTSIIRTLQFYSMIASDGTSYVVLRRSADSSLSEVSRSLGVLAQIIERTMIYLEKRFINLKDYLISVDAEDYTEFSKVFSEKEYTTFLSVIDKYIEGLTKLMDALKAESGNERPHSSMEFSKWLSDNMEINVLEVKTKEEKRKKTNSEILPQSP